MTSNLTKIPKTPHEEIMLCIESTNDIVSDMSNHLQNVHDIVSEILEMLRTEQQRKLAYINWKRGPQSDSL